MFDRHLSHRAVNGPGGVSVHGLEFAVSMGLVCAAALTSQAPAQSLQERLDESKFIRGLSEFQLPEVLEHYIATHPPNDPVQAAQYRIAVQRTVASDRTLSAHERQAGAERLLEIRSELIRDHPEDVRRAVWLADQAADLLLVVLPIEASGLTSEFGLPAPRQRARAQRVAREMNALTDEAEIEIERAILALESTPGYASDLTAQMAKRRLVEEQRNRRIPFLRGLGAYLHAELNLPPPDRRRVLYELAAELLEPLGRTLPSGLGTMARVYAGLALTRLDESEAAERVFEAVLSDPDAEDRRIAFAARMGTLRNLIAQEGVPAGLEALDSVQQHYGAADDLFFRVLIADQRFLLRAQLASQATGQQRDDLLRQALDAYTALLDAEVDTPRDTVRGIVFARLTAAAEIAAPPQGVAVIVAVAQAHHLAQHPDTHQQAIDQFQRLLARSDLDQRDRAEVLFGLAGVLLADDQLPAAAHRFSQLAQEHPTAREAERSIEMAATIAAGLYEQAPGDAQNRGLLRDVLQLVMTRYPNLATVDRWRYTAGRLALAERRYEQALDFFRQVAPDAEWWLDAQFTRATTLRSWADAETDVAARRNRYQHLLEVTQEIRPAIERGADSAGNQDRTGRHSYAASLRVLEAEALLELDEPQRAITTLQDTDTDPSLDSAMMAKAVLTRIDAYYALGRTAEVERELQRLLDVATDQAGGILAAMLESRQRGVMALIDMSRGEEAAEQARRELLPLADALARWLATHTAGRQPPATLRLRAADAYRLAEQWIDAQRLFDRILKDHPHAVEALFGRGECLFGLGDDHYVQAMEIYKRIAASAGDGDEYYWQSQLRMLQILDRTNRNTSRIAPHIQRLRQRDPKLGGERLRRAFETLQNKHS